MAVSIMVSMLVSFTLTPMLSSRFLRKNSQHKSKDSGFYRIIDRAYGRMLNWALAHRAIMVGFFLLTVLSIVPMAMLVGKDFFAFDDQNEFEIVIKTPDGTSLAGTDAVIQNIEKEAWKLRGVKHVLSTINSGGSSSVTDGSVYIALSDLTERKFTQFEVMDDARAMMKVKFPNLRVAIQPVQGVSGGSFRAQSVILNVRGPDLKELQKYSSQILELMRSSSGLVDQDTTFSIGNPEVHVHLDRAKAHLDFVYELEGQNLLLVLGEYIWNREVIPPDEKDSGQFEYYAMFGYLTRGDLLIGMARVLRNELPTGQGAITAKEP